MKPILILIVFLCQALSHNLLATLPVRDVETTRLKSLGGAGAGSVLLTEGAVLNPASVGFFVDGAMYLQYDKIKFEEGDTNSSHLEKAFSDRSGNMGAVLSDASRALKGNLSYFRAKEFNNTQDRMGITLAAPIGPKSSMGFSGTQTKRRYQIDASSPSMQKETFNQVNAGIMHVLSPEFSFGVVGFDLLGKKKEDQKAIFGLQYTFKDFVSLVSDIGTNYTDDFSNNLFYAVGSQIRIFEDFFVRAGVFANKNDQKKGNGAGISYLSPRLLFDLAIKYTKRYPTTDSITKNYRENFIFSKDREISFSTSFLF